MSIADEFLAFRQRERIGATPSNETLSIRIPKPMKTRLAIKALELGSTESETARFLILKALERYGVDAYSVV
jgi:predicted DNA-binding protein